MAEERTVGVVLYPGFESLDVYGPVEAFGCMPGFFRVLMVAEQAGPVMSAQGPRTVADHGFADAPKLDVLLVPGGIGTNDQVGNRTLLAWLVERARDAEVVTSVCSGSWLLAAAGLLDGRRATSNKMFFAGAREHGKGVDWVPKARWVEDGKFVTSSGVSAGTDMALHVVARLAGRDVAENVARAMEYTWETNPENDPFASVWGLA
jgi:transcriptional regulator GlxA family with amidase domain